MTSPWTISEAATDDIAAIAVFFRDAWAMTGPDAPGWAGATDEVIDELTHPDFIADRIGGPDRRMFIARDGERVVAFAATRSDGSKTELAGIVVLQDLVGRGVGTELLEAALRALGHGGVASVVVRTEADNERALRFYRRHGFCEERRTAEEVEGVEVEVVELRRDL